MCDLDPRRRAWASSPRFAGLNIRYSPPRNRPSSMSPARCSKQIVDFSDAPMRLLETSLSCVAIFVRTVERPVRPRELRKNQCIVASQTPLLRTLTNSPSSRMSLPRSPTPGPSQHIMGEETISPAACVQSALFLYPLVTLFLAWSSTRGSCVNPTNLARILLRDTVNT